MFWDVQGDVAGSATMVFNDGGKKQVRENKARASFVVVKKKSFRRLIIESLNGWRLNG